MKHADCFGFISLLQTLTNDWLLNQVPLIKTSSKDDQTVQTLLPGIHAYAASLLTHPHASQYGGPGSSGPLCAESCPTTLGLL